MFNNMISEDPENLINIINKTFIHKEKPINIKNNIKKYIIELFTINPFYTRNEIQNLILIKFNFKIGLKKLRKVINKVACKNQRLLTKFKELHPGCNFSESKYADQYSKIVIEAMGGAGNNDVEKMEKIIRNIAKEVVIDKSIL